MADNEEFTGQSIINRDFVTDRPSSMPIEYFVEEYGTPVVEKYQRLSFLWNTLYLVVEGFLQRLSQKSVYNNRDNGEFIFVTLGWYEL